MDAFLERNTVAEFGGEGMLHLAEESLGSRKGTGHRAQLSKHFVPFLDTCALLSWRDTGKDFGEAFLRSLDFLVSSFSSVLGG